MLADDSVIEKFIPCDFHLLDQSLTWLEQNYGLAGYRFCELGSGFGVGTLLASVRGIDSIGIEIESVLVKQAIGLAEDLDLPARFYQGNFIPSEISRLLNLTNDVTRRGTEGEVYDLIGCSFHDFDLFFAFPWPGEQRLIEAVFQAGAADDALLLTYRGCDGMRLARKV